MHTDERWRNKTEHEYFPVCINIIIPTPLYFLLIVKQTLCRQTLTIMTQCVHPLLKIGLPLLKLEVQQCLTHHNLTPEQFHYSASIATIYFLTQELSNSEDS